MFAYSAITSTSDYASTSNLNEVTTENNVSYIDELHPISANGVTRTTTDPRLTCIGCNRGTDLAQSFVLYFAPTVIVLALIMCITRLLFTFCAFRRREIANATQQSSSATRHHGSHTHTRSDNVPESMRYHIRGSFAHIFMQSPPPTYEQAQKHSAPFESPNDPAPPAYAYENPVNIRDEHPPTTRYFRIFNFLSIFVLNLIQFLCGKHVS
uniref:Uncharacterized protein n=1 Tax=Parascaris univalens TaxID=6257 RepID=A0A915BJY2_PARUN